MPKFRYDSNGAALGHPVGAPLRSFNSEYWQRGSPYGTARRHYPYIDRKIRLKSVTLDVTGQADRSLTLHYRSSARGAACPGLLDYVESSATRQSRVDYEYTRYENLASGQPRTHGMPPSLCVLSKVKRADNSTWEFDYGLVSSPQFSVSGVDHFYPSSSTLIQYNDRRALNQSRGDFYAHLPLRSVKIPTGAKVTYDYLDQGLGLCEYQDYNRRDENQLRWYGQYSIPYNCREGEGKSAPRTPAVTKRTVTGVGISTATTDIYYKKNWNANNQWTLAGYTVERWIATSARTSRLVFHRSDRVTNPTSPYRRMRDGGKLMTFQIYSGRRNPSNSPSESSSLVSIDFEYTDKNNAFHKRQDWYNEPKDSTWLWWREANNRGSFAFDMRQVRLAKKATSMDGLTMTTEYLNFDEYNNPTLIIEKQSGYGYFPARRTDLTYDNRHAQKSVWFVGALESKTVDAGTTGNADSDRMLTRTKYNSKGLVEEHAENGVITTYTYHPDGEVKTASSGGTTTSYLEYENGVPTVETVGAASSPTRRSVDNAGNVTQLTDPVGRRTSYSYRPSDHALIKVTPPSALGVTTITPPNWQGDRVRREEGPGTVTRTSFDVLGRQTLQRVSDRASPYRQISRSTKYDSWGRTTFLSEPTYSSTSSTGVLFSYDALDRLTTRRHTSESTSLRFCYGPPCNSQSSFNGAGTIGFGHAVRDQAGFVSVYNYRALGSLENRELMNIRREIRRSSDSTRSADSQDRIAETILVRNLAGFVTRIGQGGVSSSKVYRDFEPYAYVTGGKRYVTTMLGSETHPEFGDSDGSSGIARTVLSRDEAGRIRRVVEYDGSEYAYVYDARGNLDKVTQVREGDPTLESVDTIDYSYDDSNLLRNIVQGDSRLIYYYDNAGLLIQEELWIHGQDNQYFGLSYQRNNAGHVTQVRYPTGRRVNIDRNGFGQATGVDGFVAYANYHPNGELSGYGLSNGTSLSLTLDNQQRPDRRIVNGAAGTIFDQNTNYDTRGNVSGITDYFAPSSTDLRALSYDGLSRLLGAKGSWGEAQYYHDEVGNLTYVSIDGRGESYSYDNRNRLDSTFSGKNGHRAVSYDDNGNVRSHGHRTYSFDARNRLLKTVKHDEYDTQAPIDVRFTQTNRYDGRGLRIKATTEQPLADEGGSLHRSTTYYFYNRDGELMYEYDREAKEHRDHIRLAGKTVAIVGRHDNRDSDGDGMPDYFERMHGLDSLSRSDAYFDPDGDGRSNLQEFRGGSNPQAGDSDYDGVPDGVDPDHVIPARLESVVLEPIFQYLGN